MIQKFFIVFLSVLITLSVIAQPKAQIYTYTDRDGVLHFTNVPTDKRFRLYKPTGFGARAGLYRHQRYDSIIKLAARKHGLDWALIKAMIHVESNFNPRAISRKGAKGLMQLMPETAKRMAVNNSFDPWENINGGVRFFRHLLSQLNGDMILALAAYNAGLDAVRKYKRVPPFRETNRFVKKVLYYFRHYQ
ncbi:MAG: lytic transglycosylase domain-containing protein [Deltaproteobacteria bacterium]|nr:lytic transglycosylase domain-containing protein [Deltaproteobacteria bacterium]MBW2305465.1 lytic transglycosylase domain-containing protein [Deltaproteobacteria bacterium]